jgi:uncharacterized membrane protein YgaE (UPF0421/DUF939 family)
VGDAQSWLRVRPRVSLRDRVHRLRLDLLIAVQSGVAAGLAWLVASEFVGHVEPFFAPIAAVIVLSASVGQRWRRALELVFGVALGIAVADAVLLLIGVGVVQIAAIVTLAILAVIFLGGGALAMAQAASSAVLVATLAPPSGGIYLDRFVDALIGGGVGILVMALLLPLNPLTKVQRSAGAALTQLADALALDAESLRSGDAWLARRGLADLRASDADHHDLREQLSVGRETVTLAPIRWRSRPALSRYLHAAVHIERATRNVRILSRRCASVLDDAEPVPAQLPAALATMAECVGTLRTELATGAEPVTARERGLEAVRAAAGAYAEGVGFSGSVVVAQVRSATVDLLRATGIAEHRAERLVARAVRAGSRPQGSGADPAAGPAPAPGG